MKIAPEKPIKIEKLNTEKSVEHLRGRHVLVICTDPLLRKRLAESFEGLDCKVMTADNSMTGLDTALSHPPEVVLLSLQGENDRVDRLLKLLRLSDRTSNAVMVLIRLRDEPLDLLDCLNWGADDLVEAGFTTEWLQGLISARIRLYDVRRSSIQQHLVEVKKHFQNLLPPHFSLSLANIEGFARALETPSLDLPLQMIQEKARKITEESLKLTEALRRFKRFAQIELMCLEKAISSDNTGWDEEDGGKWVSELAWKKARAQNRQRDLKLEVTTELTPISKEYLEVLTEECMDHMIHSSKPGQALNVTYTERHRNLMFCVSTKSERLNLGTQSSGIKIVPFFPEGRHSTIGLAIAQRLAELGQGVMTFQKDSKSQSFIKIELPLPNRSHPRQSNNSPCSKPDFKGEMQDSISTVGEFTTGSTS